MKIIKELFVFIIIGLSINSYAEATQSPLGYFRTYDLENHPRSIVRFSELGDTLQGVITAVLPPDSNQARCIACKGKWHNQPLVGLPIIWGLKKRGPYWINGYVLNINNGKIYRCQLRVSNDNRILYFSAYIGIPLLGKTLNWVRVKAP